MTSSAELLALAQAGETLRDQGDLAGADAHMIDVVTQFPDFLHGAIVWADIAMRAGQWPEAARRWLVIRDRFPDQELAWIEYPAALRQAGNLPAARDALVEAHARFPDAGRPLHDLARLAQGCQDWQDAADWWGRYREVWPRVWFGYTEAAGALRALGEMEQADDVLLAGYRMLSDAAMRGHDLAKVSEARGDWMAAARHWSEQRTEHPGDWNAYANELQALRRARRPDLALAVLRDAAKHLPNDPRPLDGLARLAEELGDWEAARLAWVEYCAKFEPVWWSFAAHAQALDKLGRSAESEALLRDTIGRFPNEVEPIRTLVVRLKDSGRSADAAAVLDSILRRDSSKVELLALRSDLLLVVDREDDAFADWLRLPDNSQNLVDLKRRAGLALLWRDGPAPYRTVPFAAELLRYLVAEPDTGAVDWVPCYNHFLHNLVIDGRPPIASMTAFFHENPALFAGSLHRLMWIAVLGITPDENDMDEVIDRVVVPGRFGIASLLFSNYVLRNRPVWKDAVLARLYAHARTIGTRPASNTEYLEAVLCVAITSMYQQDVFWDYAAALHRTIDNRDPASPGVPATPRQILGRYLAGISQARRLAAPPVIASADRRLRIALCISGQMRGFREAYPTWQGSGLFRHDVTVFVHTWREIGTHWRRNWDFFQFTHRDTWEMLRRQDGKSILAAHFPTLAAEVDSTAATHVDVSTLREFYQTKFVEVEDDTIPPFVDQLNDWKMLYKIGKAHELAVASRQPFDLFVRLRPDVSLDFHREPDLVRMAAESAWERKLYMDEAVFFTGFDSKFKAGDQIAIGAGDPMGVYAGAVAWDHSGGTAIGGPRSQTPHQTLGTALFTQGVMSEELTALRSKQLLNGAVLSPATVAALAELDAANAPDTPFARGFLDACRRVGEGAA